MTVNLVGDKYDTLAGKIIARAGLDEMRGSVLENLCNAVADALRHAEMSGQVDAYNLGFLRCREETAKEIAALRDALEDADDVITLLCPEGEQTNAALLRIRAALSNIAKEKT